ncbi:MAG TPA: long-chain fatty acid--CoA ligase, partial [Bacillota bacterium]|nr:long-chain fatty acid--CoA ligase [Bacillota bacterium]
GGVTVTIYPTLSGKTVQYIVDNSDSRILILENQEQLDKILPLWDKLPKLEHIITMEPTARPLENIYTLAEVAERGRRFEAENPGVYEKVWRSVEPDDLSSLVYTSGTTGQPKGTMLSHWNWGFNVYSVTQIVSFDPGEILLAFLPLAHVYMRLVLFTAFHCNATSYFSLPENLGADLPLIKPHAFVSVPRLFERVYDRLVAQMESGSPLLKKIFYWAVGVARQMGEVQSRWEKPGLGLKLKHRLADKLVFSKIRARLGVEQLKWACSSGSALRRELAFFFNGMGVTIIEGYGMTEVAAPSNLNPVGRFKPGTVGPPLPGTMQKIAEDGEILIKGDNVMLGYYKLPEETAEAFTHDGWLKTGDIGEFDRDGYLIFKERKKHILVLSTGKNVAPLPIEEELKKSRWVEEAVVVGDNRKFTAALIQPSFQALLEFAQEEQIDFNRNLTAFITTDTGEELPVKVDPELVRNEKVLALFRRVVEEANCCFDPFEQVKQFRLLPEALTLEGDELTPTLKVKKKVISQKYNQLIEEMYA